MLDKSIEFKRIVMKMDSDEIKKTALPVLPEGFSFKFFSAGDEAHWAQIETSVLEFESESDAENYFRENFLPHESELEKRCVFVVNSKNIPIATATAWFADNETGHRSRLHWVAVCPEYQGLGIGKAVTQKVLQIFREIEPDEPVWLHTQTWSPVAIKLYLRLGFHINSL